MVPRTARAAAAALILVTACSGPPKPEGVYDLTFDLMPADLKGRLVLPGGEAEGGVLLLLTNPPRQVGTAVEHMAGDTLVLEFAQGTVLRLRMQGDSVRGTFTGRLPDTTFVSGVRSSEAPDPAIEAAMAVSPEAPGTLSLPLQTDAFPVPHGEELVLTRGSADWRRHVLVSATHGAGGWSAPAALPFSGGNWDDRGAAFLGDSVLVFSSDRPLPGDSAGGDWNLWQVARRAGSWGEPAPLTLNSDSADFHPSIDGSGNLYFASRRAGGLGAADIWMAPREGDGWGTPVNLGAPVNSAASEGSVLVDPAGRWLLVTVTDRPGGYGNDDFWVARREGDGWGKLQNPGAPLNSFDADYGAAMDGEGGLWFTSHRRGTADLYRLPLEAVGLGGN